MGLGGLAGKLGNQASYSLSFGARGLGGLGDHIASELVLEVLSVTDSLEEARLAFCKFMVKPSTLLVLDEPTNHLDIPSKEMLEEAITEYKGTVITVSHDRYFIKQIVNRVLEVKDGSLQDYAGDYNTGSEIDCEKNIEARERELEREADVDEKSPKAKAKSKMSKAERDARKKQKMQAFQNAKAKSKGLKNAKRWK
ncbi:hypothetical protein HYC85_005070 [Camellia sinensis]|uniref:ABC transporter domain-containing protein n=1 Tax=Camellia sinensis TaxID=4442 RepID=A0A7J7HZD3_CAMSI|nr:hypothetical protein HYC85_005070 [Camellia sinensis]